MVDPNWEHEFSRFLDTLSYQIDAPSALRLDGKGHGIKCYDKEHKGKTYYIGTWKTTKAGKRFPTITVRSHAHGGVTLGYFNGFETLKGDHDHVFVPAQNEAKEERDEDAQKAANVQRDLTKFGGISKEPQGNQAAYLVKKKLLNFVAPGSVRYGTDKHGNFTAIQLIDLKTGKPVGIQRFYDRNIKGRETNKDFTWGLKKAGACHLLGQIDENYAGLLAICEGYADGVVAHGIGQVSVIVALDVGNLDAIAQTVKEQIPKAQGLVICDNDAHRYKQGVDNAGVLAGVQAAINAGFDYIIPDFTGLEQSSKPKDLWDLWNLVGDEAVDKLLSNSHTPPVQDNWNKIKLNYLGAKSFLKMLESKPIDDALELIRPQLDRLDLDEKAVVDHISQAKHKATKPAVLSVGNMSYASRLAKPDETVCIERDYMGVDLLKQKIVWTKINGQ